jgi:hypothetical protein
MTAPIESPAGAALSVGAAAPAGLTDKADLDAILADDHQIDVLRKDVEAHRQAIVDRQGIEGIAPVMLALSRLSGLTHQISGLTEQLDSEVRIIRLYLGEA